MVPVDERERLRLFEQMVLPHLDAAYNLARWLATTTSRAPQAIFPAPLEQTTDEQWANSFKSKAMG